MYLIDNYNVIQIHTVLVFAALAIVEKAYNIKLCNGKGIKGLNILSELWEISVNFSVPLKIPLTIVEVSTATRLRLLRLLRAMYYR